MDPKSILFLLQALTLSLILINDNTNIATHASRDFPTIMPTSITTIRTDHDQYSAALNAILQNLTTTILLKDLLDCWGTTGELKSACSTDAAVGFFLSGFTGIGPSYCRAITAVGHKCFPVTAAATLETLGRYYCGAETGAPPSPRAP